MAKPNKMARYVRISIDDGTGNFVPIKPVQTAARTIIRCIPTPGPNGVRYVPDWYDLTEFG